jgi:hypothetical protein
LYAGSAPGLIAGAMAINIRVPAQSLQRQPKPVTIERFQLLRRDPDPALKCRRGRTYCRL